MAFFSFIWRFFTGPSHRELLLEPAPSNSPVESLDAEEELFEETVEEPVPGWWTPRGEPVLRAPEIRLNVATGERAVMEQLTPIVQKPGLELPKLPYIAQKAMLLLRSENVNYRTLAELIGKDPGLSADILRVANSAYYAGMNEITRLDLAFARLGHRALRARVMAVSFKGLSIRTGGPEKSLGEELWRCSLASAVILQELAPRFKLVSDDAFLIGLLHDIGRLGVLKVVHEFQRTSGYKTPRTVFDKLCEEWHQTLGARLAQEWNLPDPLPALIGDHHREPAPDDPLEKHRLLITLADVACSMMEHAPYVPYDFFQLPCVQRLGLTDDAPTRTLLASLPEKVNERIQIH